MRRVGSLTLATAIGACAHAPAHQTSVPPVPEAPRVLSGPEPERLPNGLRVVAWGQDESGPHEPGPGAVFTAALLFAGGPLDDPAGYPALTGVLPQAGITGTEGDPSGGDIRPARRALDLGALLTPIATGELVGWAVSGPPGRAEELLTLLRDLAVRPTLPMTRIGPLWAAAREAVAASEDLRVTRAVALASGLALGLARPLPLFPDPELGAEVTRETLVRHWSTVVRPERGVLVADAAPALTLRFARQHLAGWLVDVPPGPVRTGCVPKHRSVHVLVDKELGAETVISLASMRAPGPGDPGRLELEAALALLNASPGGRMERVLGPQRARQARPRLLDVGLGNGAGASVLMLGSSGPARAALFDLLRIIEVLRQFAAIPPDPDALEGARWTAVSERLMARTGGVGRLVATATDVIFGAKLRFGSMQPDQAIAWVFNPDHMVIVGVGTPRLGIALQELGPVTLWSPEGEALGGAPPPPCAP